MPLAFASQVLHGTPTGSGRLVRDNLKLDRLTDGGDDGDALFGRVSVSMGRQEHQGVGSILLAESVCLVWGSEDC